MLPTNLVDFHCHLDLYPEFQDLIAECERRGVYTLTVTTTPQAWKRNLELSRGSKFVRAALGLHPQLVEKRHPELALFKTLLAEARYVGEIGIDGSREHVPNLSLQRYVFNEILVACADSGGRIMSIHSRGAVAHVLDALEQRPQAGTPILHWFSGTSIQLKRAISLGCYFSVGPKMLQGAKGLELVKNMPINRILTETDGPFARNNQTPLYPWDAASAIPDLAKAWDTNEAAARKQIVGNLKCLLSSIEGSTPQFGPF